MADEPEPSDEQVRGSLMDAVRKLTGTAPPQPEDGQVPEGKDDPKSAVPKPSDPEPE